MQVSVGLAGLRIDAVLPVPVVLPEPVFALVGVNQTGIILPGRASCLTRKCGRLKLWITSLGAQVDSDRLVLPDVQFVDDVHVVALRPAGERFVVLQDLRSSFLVIHSRHASELG